MKYWTLIACCFVLLLNLSAVLAQDADEQPPPIRGKQGETLTPLAMGNTWIFKNSDTEVLTIDRIEGVVLFDGKPWHLLRTYERAQGQTKAEEVSLDLDLWITMGDGYETDAIAEIDTQTQTLKVGTITKYYRYPATLNETYKPADDDPSMLVTVTALHEKVKTNAGEFDCIVYKETNTEDPEFEFVSWVAPGLGTIKTVTKEGDSTFTSELVSYTLVNKK